MSSYTRARKTYPARSARPSGPRVNQFAADCASCGQEVAAKAGVLTGRPGAWTVTHAPRRWVGVPCGGDMIGKPGMGRWVGGCPDAKAGTDAAEDVPDEAALAEARAIAAEHGGDVGHLAGIIMTRERVLAATAPTAGLVLCETGSHPVEPHAREDSCEHPDSDLTACRQRCEDAPCCGHARCGAY